MNKTFNFLIVVALVLGAGFVFLITKYVEARVKKASEAAPTKEFVFKQVLVAKEGLVQGDTFTQFNTEVKSIPEDYVPSVAITSLDQLNEKVALFSIPEGDILFTNKVGIPSELPKASAVIDKGKRLVTISVNDTSAVGYTIKNGDMVDLVGIFNVPDDILDREEMPLGGSLGVTFLQKVRVFDIVHGEGAAPAENQNSNNDPVNVNGGRLAQGTTATFMVSPNEAQIILAVGATAQNVFMVLRRFDDEEVIPQPTTLHERILERLEGNLEKEEVVESTPVEAPPEPKKKIVF